MSKYHFIFKVQYGENWKERFDAFYNEMLKKGYSLEGTDFDLSDEDVKNIASLAQQYSINLCFNKIS